MPVKKMPLEQFLAAPEALLSSDAEKQKALIRKAKEKAEAEQLKASKLKVIPSMEDLLADVIRVAEDKVTNPKYWQFRSTSRRRQELFGHYPIEFFDRTFGQFTHALEIAGLRDQPGTRLWRASRARQSRDEHTERYVDRHVMPYAARAVEAPDRGYVLLSISDTHSQYLCPFVWAGFLESIKELKPDGVLFNGDILDLPEISRHPKIPGWTVPVQDELDFLHEMFAQVRRVHDGDIFKTGGNHDIDRLASYLTQVAPALSGLRSLKIDQLLGLKDLDVQLMMGGTISSPAGTEDAKPGYLMFGHYRVHHGTKLGQNPAAEELRSAGRSGQSGHVHRSSLAFGTTEKDESMSWMSTPMGCRHEAGRAYVRGTSTGWQRGFGYARIWPDGSVHQYPVVVVGERMSVEGFTFKRKPGMKDPKPEGVWIST